MADHYRTKDPDDDLDYTFDFRAKTNGNGAKDFLGTSENIASQTVTVESGLTKDSVSANNDAVTVWLSGGTAGNSYLVTCQITTDNATPRKFTQTLQLTINE